MQRVFCIVCHEGGYTASPEYAKCACGGRLAVDGKVAIINNGEKGLNQKGSIYNSFVGTQQDSVQ